MATVVFAANNESYRKRKRAHRACCQCKRRRRRCEAPPENNDRCARCVEDGLLCSLAPTAPTTTATSLTDIPPTPSSPESRRRFIGDLNPESIFLTSGKFKTPVQRDITECGVWEESPPRTGDASTRSSPSPNHQPIPRRLPIHISPAYRGYLESIRAFDVPEKRTQDALVDIYLAEIHPVLPILNVFEFQQAREKGTVSLPLLMAVMLAAVKHPDAVGVLPAGTNQRVLAATMAERINALLNGGIEPNRFTLTRIYAFLALHSEGASGNETASLHLSTALHHAYSLGLHLNRATLHKSLPDVLLWWSLYALDVVQAVVCGRPLGVRRKDISVPYPSGIAGLQVTPEFESLLKITDVLVEVIALYRPGRSGGWTGEWREIQCPDGLAGEMLRLFYHAVCILSHRNLASSASTTTTPVRLAASSLLPSSSAPPRLASARAILYLASNSHRRWLPLPIVPYSVSLALTVFYAETLRTSDRSEFLDTCEVLEDMSRVWWFAGTMARMGRQAVERVKVAEAAGVLAELGGAEPSSSPSSNTAPPSVSGAADHLHRRREYKSSPSSSKNGNFTSSAVDISKADSTTSLELQGHRDFDSLEHNNPRHHHHKHIPAPPSKLQTPPQPQTSLPSSFSSAPSTLSSPVPDGILQLSNTSTSTSTSASISTSATTLSIAIDAAIQPAPPHFPTVPILEEEDEWFLQLFPDLALPTSFPLGWTDEGEDGGLGLE